jgi:predicted ATPase
MIGREFELAQLRSALENVLQGRPQGVVVSGEAGIGKTRLLEEFLVRASTEAIVLTGQSVDLGAVGAPYAPIKGVLRGLVDQIGPDAVLEAGGPGRNALTALLPELGAGQLGAGQPDRLDVGPNRLHETVAVVLETVSQRSPVVVVIEDLHWADDATLNLLRFLLRALTRGRILVVLSFRTEDVGDSPQARSILSYGGRVPRPVACPARTGAFRSLKFPDRNGARLT